jgi:hypothetical protein
MDAETITTLTLVAIGVITGIAYSVFNYFTKQNAEPFETKRFVASVVFGIIIGLASAYAAIVNHLTPEGLDWNFVAGTFILYSGYQIYINRGMDVIWIKLFGTKVGGSHWFFDQWIGTSVPVPTDELKTDTLYYRKMNEDRLSNMVFDQPSYLQQPIRDCVADAEGKTTWRYVIQAGAWEYIIEYGVQTGGKHYWYYKSPKVSWKPISVDTLETIRKTGKWPDYSQLT